MTATTTTATTIRSRYIMAGTIKTHYWEVGDNGPVVIALHGGGAGTSGSAGMGALMLLLGDSFRVIAVDGVGGFGYTDPAAPAPYGVQSRVDHLERVVEAMCLDKFAVIGNSQGAWVAAKYAIEHPDRVTKMALVASATIGAAMGIPEEHTPAFKALAGYDFTRDGMVAMLKALVHNEAKVTPELVDLRFHASLLPGVREALAGFGAGGRYLQSEAMFPNFDMRTTLPAITKHIPTIFFWGKQDAFVPMHVGEKLQKMLPDVRFYFVDGAGHQVQTDQAESVASTMRSFF